MKTQRSNPLMHVTQAAMLIVLLAFGSVALSQGNPAQLSVTELQTIGKESTVKFKDGQVLTFQQLEEMTEAQQKVVRDKVEKRSEWIKFREWSFTVANARNVEADKRLFEIRVENVPNIERLADTMRQAVTAGIRLDPSYLKTIQFVTNVGDENVKAGLKPETLAFYESLLKRPELFKK